MAVLVRCCLGLCMLCCAAQVALAVSAARWRADLQQKARFFCAKQEGMQALWQAGIYDTLLSLRRLSHIEQVQQLARTQAQREGSAGYAYGRCQDGRSWVLSVSAPYAAQVEGNRVKLAAGLQDYCRGLQARYAPSSWQRTQAVAIKQQELSLPRQGNGLVAVSCLSRQPHQTGPRLLYVFPVGKPALHARLLPQNIQRGQEQQAVQTWVNALRAKMGLKALSGQKMLQGVARFSVIHNRKELYKIKQALRQQNLHLLGENRARGYTLAEALTMLWVSPFHRQLLLHATATQLLVDVVRQKNQVLVTLLISAALPKSKPKTAKR